MKKKLIEVKDLSKVYTLGEIDSVVLSDLNIVIESGEFISIMGPSGSGKSTLMHILGMLSPLSSGEYYFKEKKVSNFSDDKLAKMRNKEIGFVFQSFNLLSRTTVLENVKLPLMYSEDKTNMDEKAINVLKEVGLDHRLNYYTNQISGGEKQRVAIARALVNGPDVIFADEPTGNLDSKSGQQIMRILQDLHSKGKTIILVTHETYTAEHAERMIKVLDGKIIADEKIEKRRFAKDGGMFK